VLLTHNPGEDIMTDTKESKTYKLYKPIRENYVETTKSLLRGAEYLGEIKLPVTKSTKKK
jgi:hypothetical protein